MHIPAHNAESDPAILRQFIRNNPLGILTTAIRSDVHPLIQSSHIPWIVDDANARGESGMGRLRGHIARQNPQAKAIIEALTIEDSNSTGADTSLSDDVLVIFNNPVHHYVTPKFYQDTKPTTGKVVPTWNYEAVQVYGTAKIYFNTQTPAFGEFLSKQIDDLSDHAETSIMGYGKDENSKPWRVTDAPPRYIELLTKNIIGIEIQIKSMTGRFKMSQEKPKGDRAGVIRGFQDMGSTLGPQIAEIIEDRSASYDLKKERAKALRA